MEDVETRERIWVDVPLGGADVKPAVKDSQARLDCLWLACIPSPILASCERVENTGWFAGLKRKKTSGGQVPGFRSRHKAPQYFVCWRNQSKTGNALYHRTGKRTGVVVITGSAPRQYRREGENEARWRIAIHVRVSQPIREYTSVAVNWTNRTLVFTNSPLSISRTDTGMMVGLDRGCVHTLATSDNIFLDIPQPSVKEMDEYRRLQRKLAPTGQDEREAWRQERQIHVQKPQAHSPSHEAHPTSDRQSQGRLDSQDDHHARPGIRFHRHGTIERESHEPKRPAETRPRQSGTLSAQREEEEKRFEP